MPFNEEYGQEPARDEIDRMEGPVLLEFGAGWCPDCQAPAPQIGRLLEGHPEIRHVKVEDGRGPPPGPVVPGQALAHLGLPPRRPRRQALSRPDPRRSRRG